MAYRDYSDSVVGVAKIGSYTKGNNFVPCELRYGRHPNKGEYGICLVLDFKYYKLYGNDKFGVKSITMLDENKMKCKMVGYINRNDDILGVNTVIISVGTEEYKKILQSGISTNVVDLDNPDDIFHVDTEIVNRINKILDSDQEDFSSDFSSDCSDSSMFREIPKAVKSSIGDPSENSSSSTDQIEPFPKRHRPNDNIYDIEERLPEECSTTESIEFPLERTEAEIVKSELQSAPKKRRKWYKPWSYLW